MFFLSPGSSVIFYFLFGTLIVDATICVFVNNFNLLSTLRVYFGQIMIDWLFYCIFAHCGSLCMCVCLFVLFFFKINYIHSMLVVWAYRSWPLPQMRH